MRNTNSLVDWGGRDIQKGGIFSLFFALLPDNLDSINKLESYVLVKREKPQNNNA